jgi:imidazolonepropionase-like amidohydrolase
MWLDNLGGKVPAMKPELYKAIIDEAHKKKLKVAAHISQLADAKALVNSGVDILAHSVRDLPVDTEFISAMTTHKVWIIPTLYLDEVCFTFADPGVLDNLKKNKFFTDALDDGILDYLGSKRYHPKPEERKALALAQKNLRALNEAGVNISFGTDAGALPERIQGFGEHRELELMVASGLSPMQAIHCATENAAMMLGVADKLGTLKEGKLANFIVLSADPLKSISNTQMIQSVWLNGKKIPDSQH